MEGEVRAQGGTQRWVTALDSAGRAEYEQCRQEEIDEWASRVTASIDEHLSEDGALSSENKTNLAVKIATVMRDGFEQGMQMGMDAEAARAQPQLDRHRSIEIARLGGHG